MREKLRTKKRTGRQIVDIQKFLEDLFDGDVHAKRVESLANATLGVVTSACLAVSIIGKALAQARGLLPKHAVKQVDRLLSNQGIVVWDLLAYWVPEVVGQRRAIVVAMDWTDYDADGQATLVLSLVTSHGRATPLIWLSGHKDELSEARNDYEDACLARLSAVLPAGTQVTILADRGFGDHKLFGFLGNLGFGYVIRFRGNIHVTAAHGETRPAADWVGAGGRARKLREHGPSGFDPKPFLEKMTVPGLWLFGSSDGSIPPDESEAVLDQLKASGKDYKIYIYEGANHAFNNDTNAARYNKAAADLAWSRTLDFFKAHLS